MISETELAYWAGFFDGEGYISIYKYQNKDPWHKSPTYSVQIGLSIIDKGIVDEIDALFPGTRAIRRRHKNPNARIQYYWQRRGNKAIATLKELLPFLRLKKRQAELAIEFHERKSEYKHHCLTVDDIEFRERYYQKMRKMNWRGRHHE